MKPAVVHITSREGLSSAFMPQVVRPMSLVKARGRDVSLVVLAPLGEMLRREPREKWQKRKAEVAQRFGIPLTLLPSAPSRAQRLWDDARLLGYWLARRTGPLILHCRGTQATHLAIGARGRRRDIAIISDCRGIEAPEYLMYRGILEPADAPPHVRDEYERREHAQRTALEQADAVLCVSDAMRRDLAERWGLSLSHSRTVPCCTDVEAGRAAASRRDVTRRQLGLQDKLVVSYSGSAAPWQVLPETLATFRQISQLAANAHLLVLTTEKSALEAAIERAGVPACQVTLLSVPHAEVPAHLAAADVGLLLRQDAVVNRVASPMKFAEYIACGVPVMLTEGIGDFSELVRRERIGCVLPSTAADAGNDAMIRAFLTIRSTDPGDLHQRILRVAERELSWSHAIDSIMACNDDLARALSMERVASP